MTAIEELNKVASAIQNSYLEKWMKKGGKVIGYFCNYVPEEIMYAAGILPFRLRGTGNEETTLADAYFSNYNCSYPRHCLNLAFKGDYDFLEGIVGFFGCDHLRRIYDIWRYKVDTPFKHFIKVPHKVTDGAPEWYENELITFKNRLQEHLKVDITDERLKEAIKLCNETRSLLNKLYELRKLDKPPITGADALAITVASTSMPKKEFNSLLRQVLDELEQGNGLSDYRARLMVIAGNLDDPKFVRVIEDVGALVVTDYACYGTRMVGEQVDESISDPMRAIAKRYMESPTCPKMMGEHPRRWNYIKELVRDYKVDGLILSRLTFCELWGGEHYMLRREAKEVGLPTLVLEREYKLESVGQMKNRVQAFLEILEGAAS